MKKIDEISAYFENYAFSVNELELSKHEKIIDLQKFITINISILRANSGNPRYKPYFDRLLKVYNKL